MSTVGVSDARILRNGVLMFTGSTKWCIKAEEMDGLAKLHLTLDN